MSKDEYNLLKNQWKPWERLRHRPFLLHLTPLRFGEKRGFYSMRREEASMAIRDENEKLTYFHIVALNYSFYYKFNAFSTIF